jgi:hypothetical protein
VRPATPTYDGSRPLLTSATSSEPEKTFPFYLGRGQEEPKIKRPPVVMVTEPMTAVRVIKNLIDELVIQATLVVFAEEMSDGMWIVG